MPEKTELGYYFEQIEQFPVQEIFDGVKTPAEVLARAKRFCRETLPKRLEAYGGQQILGECMENVVIRGAVYVGKGTVLHPGVVIEGPAYIGEDCEIAAGALIRPCSVIGNRCAVGHASEIKSTVMQNGSKVASLAFAGDSMLGKSARVGSGCILANRKFNQSNVGVKIEGVYHDLGSDFFGCVLGDSSRLGANSTTLPGTHIGPYSWVLPGTVVRGFVPQETRVSRPADNVVERNPRVELK